MKPKCNMCGKCCEAIAITVPHEEMFSEKNIRGGDYKFVKENWTPLTKKEAFEINPHLQEWEKTYHDTKLYYYKCNKYDHKNKNCSIHESRPYICKEFPFYKRPSLPNGFLFYTKDCGYNTSESFNDNIEVKSFFKDNQKENEKN